jgi:hypothetical protein
MDPITVIVWLWLSWGATRMLLAKNSADEPSTGDSADAQDSGDSDSDDPQESAGRSLREWLGSVRERLDANAMAARETNWGNAGWWLRALLGAAWTPVSDLRRAGRWARTSSDRRDERGRDRDDRDERDRDERGDDERDERSGDDRDDRDERDDRDDQDKRDERSGDDRDDRDERGGDDHDDHNDRDERDRDERSGDDHDDHDERDERDERDRGRGGDGWGRNDRRQGEDYEVEVVGTRPTHEPSALGPPIPALTAPSPPAPRPEVPKPTAATVPVSAAPWQEPLRPAAAQVELPPHPAGSAVAVASPGAIRVGELQQEGTEDVAKYVAIPGASAPKTSMDVGGNTHDDAVDLSKKIVRAVDMTADPAEQAHLMIKASLKASWNALDALAAAGISGKVVDNWASAIIALETAAGTAEQLRRDIDVANNAAAIAMNVQRKTGDNVQAAVQAAGKSVADSTRYYGKS